MAQDPFARYTVGGSNDPFARYAVKPAEKPKPVQEQPKGSDKHPYAQLTQNLGDVLLGALKGGGETAINLGRLLHAIPGVSRVVDAALDATLGEGDYGNPQLFQGAKQEFTQPTNTAQRIGKGAEQMAELVGASGVVNTATRAIPTLAGRMAAEGAAGAAMNAAQGQSPMAGAVAGAAVPGVISAARGVRSMIQGAGANPVVRDAVEWGMQQGIPVDAATASGAPIVRAVQYAADATPVGGLVANQARNRADEALTATAQHLARQVSPNAATLESAGQGVRDTLRRGVVEQSKQADDAYAALRAIEARSDAPKGITTLVTEIDTPSLQFTPSKPGTAFKDLHPSEQKAVQSLFTELDAQTFERGQRLDTSGGEFAGGARGLGAGWADSTEAAMAYEAQRNSGLMRNTPNASVFRDIGGAVTGQEMRDRLLSYMEGGRSTPVTDRALRVAQRVLRVVEDAPTENALRSKTGNALSMFVDPVEKEAIDGKTLGVFQSVGKQLERLGIAPSSERYQALMASDDMKQLLSTASEMRLDGASDAEIAQALKGGIEALTDFQAPSMAMTVNLGAARKTLQPVYEQMMRSAQLAPPMGTQARALTAIDRLMTVQGQHAPLSVVDDALSDLKAALRTAPDQLGRGAGALRLVVSTLDKQVMAAAEKAGPEAVKALRAGRAATIEKYAYDSLLGRLSEEPKRAANTLTARADTSVELLRELQKYAPDELPKLGRAYVDELLQTATREGGFQKAQGVYGQWANLGESTKALLFTPEVKQNLDRFFLLAKKMAESPNPSGTSLVGIASGTGAYTVMDPMTGVPMLLGAGALSKLLHSKTGTNLVTRLMSTPRTSPAYPGLVQQLTRLGALETSQAVSGGR